MRKIADELILRGNDKEIAHGRGMLRVLKAIEEILDVEMSGDLSDGEVVDDIYELITKEMIKQEGLIKELDELGKVLYNKFGTDSYLERCTIHDLKDKIETLISHNVSNCIGVIRTERGWAGHFISSNRCRFRRNTLLTYNDIMIVVSSVGLLEIDGKFDRVGADRHFETKAFHSDKDDKRYFDADVSKQVYFDNDCAIEEVDADDRANEMHEAVVTEISTKLEKGYKFEVTE